MNRHSGQKRESGAVDASISTPPYDYGLCPLKVNPPECRYLELLPGTFENEICVRLATIPLVHDVALVFEALSYTWGSQCNPEMIFVLHDTEALLGGTGQQRKCLPVTQNLASTLRHIRSPEQIRLFWIDAICINQADLAERSQQVQHMALIYQQAASVTIWLGPEQDDSTYALAVLRWWAQRASYDYSENSIDSKSVSEEDPFMAWETSGICGTARVTNSTNALISREWFGRAWVRQEVSLTAHKAIVQCGDERIPWQDLESAISCLFRYELQRGAIAFSSARSQRMLDIHRLVNRFGYPFDSLLAAGRVFKCLDPRDKVYSALGMMKAEETYIKNAIKPDYTISYDELRHRVAATMVTSTQALDILGHCDVGRSSRAPPTWAPDWADEDLYGEYLPPLYADGGVVSSSTRIDGAILHVSAVCCGKIEAVRKWAFTRAEDDSLPWRRFVAELSESLRLFSSQSSRAEPTDMVTSLAHNLYIHEIVQVAEGAGDNDTEAFEDWIAGSSRALTTLLGVPEDQIDLAVIDEPELRQRFEEMIARADAYFTNRSLAVTDKGHMPLAPGYTERGDVLMVILGLRLTAILRPQRDGSYLFIGTAFTHGLNYGEALLGSLPPAWRYMRDRLPDRSSYHKFQHRDTGEATYLDPRVDGDELEVDESSLPKDWVRGDGRYFKVPDEGYLLRHGVNLEAIRIV